MCHLSSAANKEGSCQLGVLFFLFCHTLRKTAGAPPARAARAPSRARSGSRVGSWLLLVAWENEAGRALAGSIVVVPSPHPRATAGISTLYGTVVHGGSWLFGGDGTRSRPLSAGPYRIGQGGTNGYPLG